MPDINLVSYNLNHSAKKDKLIKNICWLASLGTKVFCFQEIRTAKDEQFIGDAILQALGPSWKGDFLVSYDSKNDYGLGIVWDSSILELITVKSVDFPLLPGLITLERLIEQYLLSGDFTPVKRAALIANFSVAGQTLRVSNVHADWHGGFNHRLGQLEFLLDQLKSESVATEIICGDFNTIGLLHNSKQIKRIQELFGPEFTNLFPKFGLTTIHGQHLDHIFVRNCSHSNARVCKIFGSDHFPIMTTLNLTE